MDKIFVYIQQHLAWIIAGGSLLVAIFNIWITKRRAQKALSFRVITDTLLIRRSSHAPKVQVLYEGRPVSNVRLIQVELRNIGGQPLSETDFKQPMGVAFPQDSEIFEAEVARSYPETFNPEIKISQTPTENSVLVTPTLMNQKDWLLINILTTASSNQLKQIGRVSGVHDFSVNRLPAHKRIRRSLIGAVCAAIVGVALNNWVDFERRNLTIPPYTIWQEARQQTASILYGLGIILLIVGIREVRRTIPANPTGEDP